MSDFKPYKIGKYLLLEKLAAGGMAEVYRAKASGAGGFEKQIAIKRILPNYAQNDEFRRMFEYEARLCSSMTHANIAQVYDFVKSGDTYLLAMEFVDGKNLRQFVNKAKKSAFAPPVEYSVFVINEVCKGLEYAHNKKDDMSGKRLNIIHRDMSPQNIMLSYDGAVKIVDFGIAKAKDRVDETRSGVIKGKFGYMSPEQANGLPVDHRSDIFSTGIILWEMLTGRRLFAAENDMATLKLIQECQIPPPSRINPKVPLELEKIVLKALTKDLKLRYQDAGLFHRNLQEYLNKHFSRFSQREVAEIVQELFKLEIETEKKRFEQVLRQSIPFSQGAREGIDSDNGEDPLDQIGEELDGGVTKSEAAGNTAVTFVDEVTPEPADESFSISEDSRREEPRPEPKESEKSEVDLDLKSLEDEYEKSDPSRRPNPKQQPKSPQVKFAGQSRMIENTNLTTPSPIEFHSTPNARVNPDQEKSHAPTPVTQLKESQKAHPTTTPTLRDEVVSAMDPNLSQSIATEANTYGVPSQGSPLELERPKNFGPPPERPQRKNRTENKRPQSDKKSWSGSMWALILVLVLGLVYLWQTATPEMSEPVASAPETPHRKPTRSQQRSPDDIPNTGRTRTRSVQPRAEEAPPTVPAVPGALCALKIDSDPPGAEVLIDDESFSNKPSNRFTPTTVSRPCGTPHYIKVRMQGYEDHVPENIQFNTNKTGYFKKLKKVTMGELLIMGSRRADVFINGERVGEVDPRTPFRKPLRAGHKYKIRLSNDIMGIPRQEEEVLIQPDLITTIQLR